MNNRIFGALALLVVVMCIGGIILVVAEPTPFVINGELFDADGNPCNDPSVNVTNTNTGSGCWIAETYPGSNYYQLVLANGIDLNASETLRFEVTNSDGNQSKIVEQTVTEDEIDDGGLFDFNITLAPTALIFDTGASANPYPSIFGTHNGTITPDVNITVNRMYTYPCAGTGGHTEYVRIWNESYEEIEGEGYWSGYQSDYHNITISPTITLVKNHEYNYTIRTGSYPQIIHESNATVTGGNITCTEFIDANGKRYNDWIPAIKFFRCFS